MRNCFELKYLIGAQLIWCNLANHLERTRRLGLHFLRVFRKFKLRQAQLSIEKYLNQNNYVFNTDVDSHLKGVMKQGWDSHLLVPNCKEVAPFCVLC